LLAEVGGGAVLHSSDWFVMVASGPHSTSDSLRNAS
jgi:hypothetical protein